jgi:hypothetical protein
MKQMNNQKEISRRRFISNSALGSLGTFGVAGIVSSCGGSKSECPGSADCRGLKTEVAIRPYQLMCAVCSIGEGNTEDEIDQIKAIRQNPDVPITLICNAGDIFAYQDPGSSDDAHGNAEFNRKRDLEILQRIDLHPGVKLPARIILHRIWDRIETVSGICNCEEQDKCKGCPKADKGFYEKGREISLLYAVPGWASQLDFSEADLPKAKNALIIPRTKEERAEAKRKSLKAMVNSDAIAVRPHILMCAVCQYGEGSRPPFETDNLPEMIQFILKNKDSKIRIAEAADWMMCAPCPSLNKFNACINVKGHAGLTSQLRDVRVLQKLGLAYGDVINAQDLYQKILERIPSSSLVCGSISKGVRDPSVWDDECGHHSESLPAYTKGRDLLIKEFGFKNI